MTTSFTKVIIYKDYITESDILQKDNYQEEIWRRAVLGV